MIKAEEISTFIRNKKAICKSFESCNKCPIADGYRCCHNENLTQEQVDLIMSWELPVDWSKVPIDTKVIVWNIPGQERRRYFAKYENGKILAFDSGSTSWSHEHELLIEWWHGRLAEDGE